MFRHLRTLQQVSRRTLSSSSRRQLENKVPVKQKMFQVCLRYIRHFSIRVLKDDKCSGRVLWMIREEDNGMPVHLKGGAKDALLYRATMALTVFGCGYVVYSLINAALPKKKD